MISETDNIIIKDRVKMIVDLISKKEFEKLHQYAYINKSWRSNGETNEEGFKKFGKWITGQLDMWAEDEGNDFVVDAFEEDNLEIDELPNGIYNCSFQPTSYGGELDFWFEFKISIAELEKTEFNVNM